MKKTLALLLILSTSLFGHNYLLKNDLSGISFEGKYYEPIDQSRYYDLSVTYSFKGRLDLGVKTEHIYYNPGITEHDEWKHARSTFGASVNYAIFKQQTNRTPVTMLLGVGQYFNKFDHISELNFGLSKYFSITDEIAVVSLVNLSGFHFAHQYESIIAVPTEAFDTSFGLNLILKNLYAFTEIHYYKPQFELDDLYSNRLYLKFGVGFVY